MICRNVDVNDLSRFDFFNDFEDTLNYLMADSRVEEATLLRKAEDIWWDEYQRKMMERIRDKRKV